MPTSSAPARTGLPVLGVLVALLSFLFPVTAYPADRGPWAPNVPYAVGDLVTHLGKGYDCRQSHTSLVGWEPPNVPALWLERTSAPDTQAPTAPTQLTSTAKNHESVTLSWSASSDDVGVTGYEVFVDGGATASATTAGATTVTVAGLAANTTYTFTVKARDAAGNRSAPSAAHSTTTSGPPPVDTEAPSAPTEPRSTSVGSTSVSLAWNASTDNVGVTGYEVFVNGGATASATTTGATSATVSGLAANTTYAFTVRARDAAGNRSAPSAAVSVTTTNAPPARSKVLVGYWHNFDNGSTNIRLRDVSAKFDVIQVAFAEPVGGAGSGTMGFTPYNSSVADFKADIALLRSQGRRVLISIGGANGTIHLDDATARQNFVASMQSLITTYGFDGLDLDLEGSSLSLNGGDTDFRNPTTPRIVNLIQATRQLLDQNGSGFLLTMAPETAYVQGGMAAYGGPWGAYLPVIHALRDRLTYLHVQHYNTGTVTALDGRAYAQGTPDFHVAMAEMLLRGFPWEATRARPSPP